VSDVRNGGAVGSTPITSTLATAGQRETSRCRILAGKEVGETADVTSVRNCRTASLSQIS
jgi:hypothetical protein